MRTTPDDVEMTEVIGIERPRIDSDLHVPRPLVVPLYCKACDCAKQIRLVAVARQVLDCLVNQEAGLLPRTLFAEQRDEGRFPGMCVLACVVFRPPLRRRCDR